MPGQRVLSSFAPAISDAPRARPAARRRRGYGPCCSWRSFLRGPRPGRLPPRRGTCCPGQRRAPARRRLGLLEPLVERGAAKQEAAALPAERDRPVAAARLVDEV